MLCYSNCHHETPPKGSNSRVAGQQQGGERLYNHMCRTGRVNGSQARGRAASKELVCGGLYNMLDKRASDKAYGGRHGLFGTSWVGPH